MYRYFLGIKFWLCTLIPTLLCVGFVGSIIRANMIRDTVDAHYRALAKQAISDADYSRARIIYSRLIDENRIIDPKDLFDYFEVLSRDGDTVAANGLLDQLAPDSDTGHPEAHRVKSIQIARMLARGDSAEDNSEMTDRLVKQLRHHLTRSGSDNPLELCDLWAAYHFRIGQEKQALQKLVESAAYAPERWMSAAEACAAIGDERQQDKCYRNAESHYLSKLKADPLDHQSRIGLAKAFVQTKRADSATTLLSEGLDIADCPELRRAAADLRLFKLDQLPDPLVDHFPDFMRLLGQAFELDPTNPHAYGRLMAAFKASKSDEQSNKLRESLQRLVAQGDSIAFAHFSLGALYWQDEDLDNAIWHTEKALQIDPGLMDVANNAAWFEGQREGGDLQRALQLIDLAIAKQPNRLEYRDTKAMILVKLELWDQALVELERLLPNCVGSKRKNLHTTLSTVYSALGKSELAKLHLEEASKLATGD